MKLRTKIITSIIAFLLSGVLAFVGVITINHLKSDNMRLTTRTISLTESVLEVQSIFDEFEDATLTKEGTVTYFEGFKPLDKDTLSEIDYISDDDLEFLEESTVKYNFSYDSESNIVTLSAMATLPDGSIEIDKISGVGFINENNEIDAVMNLDGEGVLLSEMRDAGLIQNCGWFSKLIKAIAVAVAVVAVVAVAAAVVVATAGVAAPAVVAAGVGVSTTVVTGAVATATTIGTYAAITAAIAAGVALTTDLWERYYPGADIVVQNGKSIAKTYDDAKDAIRDIAKTNRKDKDDPDIYFECEVNSNLPINIRLDTPHTLNQMVGLMQIGTNSITDEMPDAETVIAMATLMPVFPEFPDFGVPHFHACDISNRNYSSKRDLKDNPRVTKNNRVLHSFWCAV